jgi:uncharacterized membrane protein
VTNERAWIFVDRPPEEVFDYLIKLNDAEWRSGVVGMRLTSKSHEGVGSTHIEVRNLLAWRVETSAEVVTYEPNRRWAVRRASGPVRPQVSYTIESEQNGTRLAFRFEVPVLQGPTRLLAPLARLLTPVVEKAFRKDLRRLKERLEAYRPGE